VKLNHSLFILENGCGNIRRIRLFGPCLPLLLGTLNDDSKAGHMSSVMCEMRLASADIHISFEQRLAISRPDAGPKEYLAFVCAMWGWLAPFERQLWSLDWPAELMAHSRDGKRRWLECDIRAGFGQGTVPEIARSLHRPNMDTLAERFGIAYVIEGAQMGSRVLRKTMGPALHPWPARWLAGYGDTVGSKWLAFRTSAEHHLRSQADMALAAASARATFESLDGWFQKTDMA
jgi:heme oxygenase